MVSTGVLDLSRVAELVPDQDGFQVRQPLGQTDQLSVQDGAWRQRRQYLHFGVAAAVVRQLPAPQVPAAGRLGLVGSARQGADAIPFHLKEILRPPPSPNDKAQLPGAGWTLYR